MYNVKNDLGWAVMALIAFFLFLAGIKGVFSKNHAKDIHPVFHYVERENVTDLVGYYEMENGDVFFSYGDYHFPANQIASGNIELPDGSYLSHREDGEIFLSKETIVTDQALVKQKRKLNCRHTWYVIGGLFAWTIAFVCGWIAALVGPIYFYEVKQERRGRKK